MTVAKRTGATEKISISVRSSDLAALRRRADRLYDGNVSAVIAELAADAALFENMEKLLESLGGATLTDEERAELDRDWARPAAPTAKPTSKKKKTRQAA